MSAFSLPGRQFVRACALAFCAAASPAWALTVAPYSATALAAAQDAGKPVVLHFHAGWCPTCRAQDKVLEGLKSDPGLDVSVLQADFDTEKALEKQLGVSAQSTFIVYHGHGERGRVTAVTDPARLKAVLKLAL